VPFGSRATFWASAVSFFDLGTLVKFIGFQAIGYAAIVLVALELLLFNETRKIVLRAQPTDAERNRQIKMAAGAQTETTT